MRRDVDGRGTLVALGGVIPARLKDAHEEDSSAGRREICGLHSPANVNLWRTNCREIATVVALSDAICRQFPDESQTSIGRAVGGIGRGSFVVPDRYSSTPAAQARPSAIAQTISD